MSLLAAMLIIFLILLVLLLGLSIGIAFLLAWMLPGVGLEMALLVAVIAVGQAILFIGKMMNALPENLDPDVDDEPSVIILDRELNMPRRRRKRT
jgi:hypothetical protein